MGTVRVFCIDGVVIEIPGECVTREELAVQALMPIENQPTMAKVLHGTGVALLSPDTAAVAAERYGGRMVEDRNTETFGDVADVLGAGGRKDWP